MVKQIALVAVLAATAAIPARHAEARVFVVERGPVIVPVPVYPPRIYYAYPPPVIAYPPAVAYPPPPMAFPAPPPVALPSAQPAPAAPPLAATPGCREYQSRATIAGRAQETFGTACLQPDGSWRITQ